MIIAAIGIIFTNCGNLCLAGQVFGVLLSQACRKTKVEAEKPGNRLVFFRAVILWPIDHIEGMKRIASSNEIRKAVIRWIAVGQRLESHR